MQRLFDLVISISALIILSPLLIPVCFLLKLTGEGEIFYTQERIGIYGNKFKLLKFATMLKNSPNIGSGELTLINDPRVLPVGKFLRKSKINELPQSRPSKGGSFEGGRFILLILGQKIRFCKNPGNGFAWCGKCSHIPGDCF